MPEFIAALLVTWPIHAVPALVFAVPTFLLTRKRIAWRSTDCLGFVIPWFVWFLVFAFGSRAASLSSAVIESLLLGCVVGLSSVAFVFLQTRISSSTIRPWLLASVCTFAIVMWAFFPFLGE
jgi:hypothetical protein